VVWGIAIRVRAASIAQLLSQIVDHVFELLGYFQPAELFSGHDPGLLEPDLNLQRFHPRETHVNVE